MAVACGTTGGPDSPVAAGGGESADGGVASDQVGAVDDADPSGDEQVLVVTEPPAITAPELDSPDTTVDFDDEDGAEIPPLAPDEGIGSDIVDRILGLAEGEAIELAAAEGYGVRVEARNGEQFVLTQDYVENRLNLIIVDDVVDSVRVG